eukprot:PhM_4_TR2476/c0_g1_i1/m.6663
MSCPKGHTLVVIPKRNWICNECETEANSCPCLCCDECDYNICRSCFNSTPNATERTFEKRVQGDRLPDEVTFLREALLPKEVLTAYTGATRVLFSLHKDKGTYTLRHQSTDVAAPTEIFADEVAITGDVSYGGTSFVDVLFCGSVVVLATPNHVVGIDTERVSSFERREVFSVCSSELQDSVTCLHAPQIKTQKPFVYLLGHESGCITYWSGATKFRSIDILKGRRIERLLSHEGILLAVTSATQMNIISFWTGKLLRDDFHVKPTSKKGQLVQYAVFSEHLITTQFRMLNWLNLRTGAFSKRMTGDRTTITMGPVGSHFVHILHCPSAGFVYCLYNRNGEILCERPLPVDRNSYGDKMEMAPASTLSVIFNNYALCTYRQHDYIALNVSLQLWSPSIHCHLPAFARHTVKRLLYYLVYRRQILLYDNFEEILAFMMWYGMPSTPREWLSRRSNELHLLDITYGLQSNLMWVCDDNAAHSVVETPGQYRSNQTLSRDGPVQFLVVVQGTVSVGVYDATAGEAILVPIKGKHHHATRRFLSVSIHYSRGLIYIADENEKVLSEAQLPSGRHHEYHACVEIGLSSHCALLQKIEDFETFKTDNNSRTDVICANDTVPCSCGAFGHHALDPHGNCLCACGRIGPHVMQYHQPPICGVTGMCVCGTATRHMETTNCVCECGRVGVHMLRNGVCAVCPLRCACGILVHHEPSPRCECNCGKKGVHSWRQKVQCGALFWSVTKHNKRLWPNDFLRTLTTTLHTWMALQLPADSVLDIMGYYPWDAVENSFSPPYFGRCLCGAVRLVSNADPLNAFYNHHRFSTRLYGAPYVVQYVFPKATVAVQEGAKYLKKLNHDLTSTIVVLCSGCHTILLEEPTQSPNIVLSSSAAFDFASRNEIPRPFVPRSHLFAQDQLVTIAGTEKLRSVAIIEELLVNRSVEERVKSSEANGDDDPNVFVGCCLCEKVQYRIQAGDVVVDVIKCFRANGSPWSYALVCKEGSFSWSGSSEKHIINSQNHNLQFNLDDLFFTRQTTCRSCGTMLCWRNSETSDLYFNVGSLLPASLARARQHQRLFEGEGQRLSHHDGLRPQMESHDTHGSLGWRKSFSHLQRFK